MARQIEIRIADQEHRKKVVDALRNPEIGGICDDGPHNQDQIIQIEAVNMFLIQILCPTSRVGSLLKVLSSAGCGKKYGIVTVSTVDAMQPRFEVIRAMTKMENDITKTFPITHASQKSNFPSGFEAFKRGRLTTEEIYNTILLGAKMDVNTWILLIGAAVLATVGLASNSSVAIVASMLVSVSNNQYCCNRTTTKFIYSAGIRYLLKPMIGPILAITFAVAVRDQKLLVLGIISEAKMCFTAFTTGAILTLTIFGHVSRIACILSIDAQHSNSDGDRPTIIIPWLHRQIVWWLSILCMAKSRNGRKRKRRKSTDIVSGCIHKRASSRCVQ